MNVAPKSYKFHTYGADKLSYFNKKNGRYFRHDSHEIFVSVSSRHHPRLVCLILVWYMDSLGVQQRSLP